MRHCYCCTCQRVFSRPALMKRACLERINPVDRTLYEMAYIEQYDTLDAFPDQVDAMRYAWKDWDEDNR